MLCAGGFWHLEVPSLLPALAFPPVLLQRVGWLCLHLKTGGVAKVGGAIQPACRVLLGSDE